MRWCSNYIAAAKVAVLAIALSGCGNSGNVAKIDVQQAKKIEIMAFQGYLKRHERSADEFTGPDIEEEVDGWVFRRYLKNNSSSWLSTCISHYGGYDIIAIPNEDFARAHERVQRRMAQ